MRKIYLSAILLLIMSLSTGFVDAIGYSICSYSIEVQYTSVPSTIPKLICVKNINSIPVQVSFQPSTNIESLISFSQQTITLQPNEKKWVSFDVEVNQASTWEGTIKSEFSVNPDDPLCQNNNECNFPKTSGFSNVKILPGTECNSGELEDCTVNGCAGQKLCTGGSWGACEKLNPNCGGCSEDWTCNGWSTCTNNQQTRTCTDQNACGTTATKPITFQVCGLGCAENWQCSSWGTCTNNQQTRTCTDQNACGTTADKPSLTQSCSSTCTENWQCSSWGACQSSSTQSRTCADANGCGTTNSKPALSQSCTYSSGSSGGGGGGSSGGSSRRSSGGGSSGGPSLQPDIGISTSRSWASIEPGKYSFEVSKEGLDVTWMEFAAGNTKTGVKLSFTQLYNKPANVPALDNLYKYFEIVKTNLDESDFTSSIIIRFKVQKEWFTEKGFDPESVVFNRYANGKWNRLATKQLSEDDDYFYYEATSPGLSYFAVTADMVKAPEKTGTDAEIKEEAVDAGTGNGIEETPETPGVAQITGAVTGEPNQNTADAKGGKNIFGLAVILTIIAGLFLLIEKFKN